MHLSFRSALALLALAVAAAASWYFGRPAAQRPAPADAARSAPLSYYLRDATLLGSDEDGRLLFRIHASEAVQGRNRQGLELTGVRVEYRDTEAVNWSIRAERAVTSADHGYVELQDVRLENDPPADGAPMTIEAPHLRLDPEAYYASTDGAVDIRIGATALGGVGLEARLNDDFVELKSDVHGVYTR